jgi:hypothetical protein
MNNSSFQVKGKKIQKWTGDIGMMVPKQTMFASDNEPDLVLSWEMPRAQIPEQVDGMDVPKRESPVIQLEAIVSHHCECAS